MSKKNTQSNNNPDLRVINGDMNSKSYGLGDPCVPMELSYFPEENPKSRALLSEVDSRDDQVEKHNIIPNTIHSLKSVLPKYKMW